MTKYKEESNEQDLMAILCGVRAQCNFSWVHSGRKSFMSFFFSLFLVGIFFLFSDPGVPSFLWFHCSSLTKRIYQEINFPLKPVWSHFQY